MKSTINQWMFRSVLCMACVAPYVAHAAAPVAPAQYNDSRHKSLFLNPNGGLQSVGIIGSILDYTIGWSITDLGGGNFNYLYNLSNILSLSAAQKDLFL